MTALRNAVRQRLAAVADPARAPAMQAYMKSAMPYLGVPAVPLRQACKEAFTGASFADNEAWQRGVLAIWRGAEFREERYAAIELCKHRSARGFQRLAALPMYREMIVTGAWWDLVDAIAGVLFFPILDADRFGMAAAMHEWASADDIWLRRSAIIFQLPAKAKTDLALLYDCIEPSLASRGGRWAACSRRIGAGSRLRSSRSRRRSSASR